MPACRKGRMHMRKKKKRRTAGITVGCGICVLTLFCAVSGTSAYLTDHEERINQITAGYNETGIEEEFPTPTPAAPEETIVKKVRVKNYGAVPCYIRISVAVSEGSVTLEGLNTTGWTDGKDGYYYYRNVVEPGSSTEDLFAGVRIEGNPEADSVTVTVYEESVQAFDGTVLYEDYQKAWEYYRGGGSA